MSGENDLGAVITRRILHLALGLIVVYYFFPPRVFGLHRDLLVIFLFIVIPVCIEYYRLSSGKLFFGLRKYEKGKVASYLWFTTGAVILLILFPQQIAAPCILGAAIGDVVLGTTRTFRRRYSFSITYIVLLIIFLIFKYEIVLAIVAAGIALISESMEIRVTSRFRPSLFYSRSKRKVSPYRNFFTILLKTDDDFMMQIVPAVFLTVVFFILGDAYLPPEILHVHQDLARILTL